MPHDSSGFQTLSLGKVEVTTISDGCLHVPLANFPNADEVRSAGLLGDVSEPNKVPIPVNCFLVRTSKNTILIDTGTGASFGPSAGHLIQNLAAAGFKPQDVDTVLMTHLHIDHVGGLVDGGTPMFINAELVLAQRELDYWSNPDFPDSAPERQRSSALAASRALKAYEGRIRAFAGRASILPGIETVALPGHTPGHTGFILDGGERRLFVWGDIIHSSLLQLAEPDWHYAGDIDRDLAAKTRTEIFSRTSSNLTLVAGMHLPFPAIGYVERSGSTFIFRSLNSGIRY